MCFRFYPKVNRSGDMVLSVNASAMRLSFALCLFASLGSCGGGSGSGVGSTPAPLASVDGGAGAGVPAPAAPVIEYDTAEYQHSTGSVAMDAIAAYDAGATGDGVIVAILDSGIKTDSPEFSGRISSASRDIVGSPSRGIVDTTGQDRQSTRLNSSH